MKKIEAMVDTGELADIRDALRDIGIGTMSVLDSNDLKSSVMQVGTSRLPEGDPESRTVAKIRVVVPDDLTRSVIMVLISRQTRGPIDEDNRLLPSIERVIRLDAGRLFGDEM